MTEKVFVSAESLPTPLPTLIRATASRVARRPRSTCKNFTFCGNLPGLR